MIDETFKNVVFFRILLENSFEPFAFKERESRVVAGRFGSTVSAVLAGARRRARLPALIMMDPAR